MIKSRVFGFFFLIFLVASGISYFFLDFRDTEEIAYSLFEEGKYFKILDLYKSEGGPVTETDTLLLSLSVSGIERSLNDPKKQKETEVSLKKFPNLKKMEWKPGPNLTYFNIEDPYFPLLKKHSLAYKKALTTKISFLAKPIPKDKATFYLLQLVVEDPRGSEESFSNAYANLLSRPLLPLGEIETGFLDQNLNFLAGYSGSVFYESIFRINGTGINLRSGPGKENPEIGKANSRDLAFCFSKDSLEETINGVTGNWRNCYFPAQNLGAWVFSGFLDKEEPDPEKARELGLRFKDIDNEVKIDFEGWSGDRIPLTFHGKYLPRKRKVISGEAGFPMYFSKNGKYERICKKLSGEKNYFEFSFFPVEAKDPVPLLEIELVYSGKSHLAYAISADNVSVWINKNRTVLEEEEKRRENLSLHIETKEGSKLIGSLWRRNTGLLQSIRSFPMDEDVLASGRYSWEVCLPLATQPDKSEVALFEIRTGVH